jgi:hypothetical protein
MMPKDKTPQQICMHIHSKGQMDKNCMNLLLEEEWAKHPGRPTECVSSFRAHVTKATKRGVMELNMQLTAIQ